MIVFTFNYLGYSGGTDDMSGHLVAADLIAKTGGPLKVDPITLLQLPQVGQSQCLLHQVEGNQ